MAHLILFLVFGMRFEQIKINWIELEEEISFFCDCTYAIRYMF